MPDERAAFFTTGQFAKLCSTTKETLFHYDSLGLLEPARVGKTATAITPPPSFSTLTLLPCCNLPAALYKRSTPI